MVLAACCYVVALLDGGATNNVGAFMPAMAPRAANQAPRSYLEAVEMSTQFTDPYVKKMKKKNKMTGSTTNLMGYKVGSRAPAMSRASGTTIFQASGRTTYAGAKAAAHGGRGQYPREPRHWPQRSRAPCRRPVVNGCTDA